MSEERILAEIGFHGGRTTGRRLRMVSRRGLEAALASGSVEKLGRDRYVLPSLDAAARAAHRLSGVQSHSSAALAHGWGVAQRPTRPHVMVGRGRQVGALEQRRVVVHWRKVTRGERDRGLTDPLDTVVDCARDLPFGEALAVADAALASGKVGTEELAEAADSATGPGAAAVRRVAAHADGRSAGPFESVLRSLCLQVEGLSVVPQVQIGDARVDLADTALDLVIEADSFEWHGGREALAKDARRYDELVADGWRVLRFSFEAVFAEPDWVLDILRRSVGVSSRTTTRPGVMLFRPDSGRSGEFDVA